MQLGYRISIARAEECGPKISFLHLERVLLQLTNMKMMKKDKIHEGIET